MTTRAVAQEAGVPPPTIFRLFGDKASLLEAVAEYLVAEYVAETAAKAADENGDPVDDLREAWRAHIEFSIANPEVFSLLNEPVPQRRTAVAAAGFAALSARVERVAAAGLLAVSVPRAVDMIHAAGSGAVLMLLAKPEKQRDHDLPELLFEAVLGKILTSTPAPPASELIALVTVFIAALPQLPALSNAERSLLSEWLSRTGAALQRESKVTTAR